MPYSQEGKTIQKGKKKKSTYASKRNTQSHYVLSEKKKSHYNKYHFLPLFCFFHKLNFMTKYRFQPQIYFLLPKI